MNNLEKYLDQVIEQKPVVYEPTPPGLQTPQSNIMQAILRRWYIALFATILLCAVGLPAVWLLVEPKYVVVGAINVSPIVRDVLTGKADYGDVGSYREFVNTQVARLLSGPALQKIADDLAGRNLSFFSSAPRTRLDKLMAKLGIPRGSPDPVTILKNAIADNVITAGPVPLTTLVAVTMKSGNPDEARQIVDSFLVNYQAMYGSESLQAENDTLASLEKNKTDLIKKIRDLHEQQKSLTAAYGTPELTARQEMELNVQTKLLGERTDLEVRKIGLETSIALLEQTKKVTMTPGEVMSATREYINSDPTVKELSAQIVDMEKNLTIARRSIASSNPELKKREALVDDFKKTLDDRKKELEKEFNEILDRRLEEAAAQRLRDAKAEYQQTLIHLQKIDERLSAQELKTQKIQRDNVDIEDIQFNLNLNNELYEDVSRRLKTLQMEQQQRPRISLLHSAEIDKIEDKRVKYMAAAAFMALACGCGLALLRDKADKTLQNPEDVSRQIGLPLLGTTTSSRTVRPELFAEQIAGDYQTIRTNLGLATSGGMPRRIAISSAGVREGKTTFAVNLATSLAKAGKKVLLIDGDLRKPDVRYMLNLQNGTAGVQEVLLGEDPSQIIRSVPGSGLHVLVANSRNLADVYELLTSPTAAEQVERLGREYDHLIVDTPPALAFPDALVWAKLTDAVILVGFAGQTTSTDLKEAKDRFTRIRVKVLGAILSNVRVEQSLYRYHYGYVNRGAATVRKARKYRRLLLPAQSGQDKTTSKNA
jgi:succinoglycan biosynthesis transport protein ExoP